MAAQVEVQTADVGRPVVGGRLHLSPLVDSSSSSLVELPSISKPAPGPRPRLSPKPFAMDRNPTIKPIVAPKPQARPRPESTRLTGPKLELPIQTQPEATPKSSPAGRPSSSRFSSGQTSKPVAQPFKPAPPLYPPEPSSPLDRPRPTSLKYSHSLKKLPGSEWSGTTAAQPEEQATPSRGGASITRAKSMGFLADPGQEEEERQRARQEVVAVLRPKPARPRPVSALFLDSAAATAAVATITADEIPATRGFRRRPLSADLTSKFESSGLSLHRSAPHGDTKQAEDGGVLDTPPPPASPAAAAVTPQSPDVPEQSAKKTEEVTRRRRDERRSTIKSRISLLLDSASPNSGAPPPAPELALPQPEGEPAVCVKQLIKQLTEDTPPTHSPTLKPTLKSRPLNLDRTKRFSTGWSPDLGGEAAERHDITSKAPQWRVEESIYNHGEQPTSPVARDSQEKSARAWSGGPEAESPLSPLSPSAGGAQMVRASLFENVVERCNVQVLDDATQPAEKRLNGAPISRRGEKAKEDEEEEEDGMLVTATYKEPSPPSSPLRAVHTFDRVSAVEESRAVSHKVALQGQREDKAATLRSSRHSQGDRASAEAQPRYLTVGALHKWNKTDQDQEGGAREVEQQLLQQQQQQEVAEASKRPKTLAAAEAAKPRATFFALTGQIQSSPSVRRNTSLGDALLSISKGAEEPLLRRSDSSKAEVTEGEKKREAKKAKMKELERQRQLEAETEALQEFKRKKEKEAERQRALQMQEQEEEKQRALARQRQAEMEKQFQLERRRAMEAEKLREQEMEKQRQKEEQERQLQEIQKEKQRMEELERMREMERMREAERRKELERRKEMEKQRQKEEKERQLLELQKEKQRLEEQERMREQKRKEEKEKQQLIEKQKQKLREKKEREEAEKIKQMALEQEMLRMREIEKERELEKERQRQLDIERQELEKQKLRQRELEKERQRKEEVERQRKEFERMRELERMREKQRQLEMEKQRQLEMEKQRQLEMEKQRLQELEMEKQRQQELERQRELEMENQRQLERQRQQELERQRQQELERQRQQELERQRQQELERQRQQELEKQRQQELERQRQQELEKQRQQELERQRQQELERQRQQELEKQRQQELERQRQQELERQRQQELEKQRLQELERQRHLEMEKQKLRQKELEKERQRKEETERMMEKLRQQEMVKQMKELERAREQERMKDKQRLEELEQAKELERRHLKEFEKRLQKEKEEVERMRLQKEEVERMRLQKEEVERMRLQKEEVERMRQAARRQESERQRLKELEKARLDSLALRPSVVDLDSVLRVEPVHHKVAPQRSDPATRWREPSESHRPSVLDVDLLSTQTQNLPSKDPSGQVPVWGSTPQDPWELGPMEMSVDQPGPGQQPQQLLAPQRSWTSVLAEQLSAGPLLAGGGNSNIAAEPAWLLEMEQQQPQPQQPQPQQPQPQQPQPQQRRSHGSAELNRMRSRSVSRRSAPPGVADEKALSRMRSRSAHREHERHRWPHKSPDGEDDVGVGAETSPPQETDSQYGTWETGLRTDDSLSPLTPSSESILSPSPKKATPTDFVDGLLPASFPEAPPTLLDTSALRSKAQLAKKRAPRSRPSRANRLSSVLPAGGATDDWLYRDTTDSKVERKDSASDSEEPIRGADSSPALPSQPQRVALFPGMDPSVLKAQLKKRSDADGDTVSPSQLSRSPKSPFLPRAARVLPPAGGKDSSEESPQWLKELKSKKRLSQYDGES